MASVTQCDVCGNVVRHEESKFIEIWNVCKNDTKGSQVANKEICDKCYNNLKKLLKMEDKK